MTRTGRPRRWVVSGTIVLLLAALWVLLWGTLSWGNLLNGLLLGVVVTTVFPLPDARVGGRLHVGALLAFVARFAVDVVIASAQVAWTAVRPGPPPVSSVVSVDVRSSSELILTVLTEALSLVPGSLVIEVDTRSSTVVAHVLEAGDDAAVARFQRRVRDVEARVIRALGTPEDLALLADERSRS